MKLNKLTRKTYNFLLAGLIIIFAFGIVLVQQVRGDNPDPDKPPDSYFKAQGPIADEETVNRSMAEKQAIEDLYERTRQDALKGPMGVKNVIHTPIPNEPDALPHTGIFEEGPLPAGWGSIYHIENRWHEMVGASSMVAFAGVKYDFPEPRITEPPGQGVLIIKTTPINSSTESETAEYLTPRRYGPVQIIEANALEITLASTVSSDRFIFDMVTRQWR